MGIFWDGRARAAQKAALAAAPCAESIGFFSTFHLQSSSNLSAHEAGQLHSYQWGHYFQTKDLHKCNKGLAEPPLGVTSQKTGKSWLALRLSSWLGNDGKLPFLPQTESTCDWKAVWDKATVIPQTCTVTFQRNFTDNMHLWISTDGIQHQAKFSTISCISFLLSVIAT